MADEPCAIYVAYRRPDWPRVRAMLDAVGSRLGPAPSWASGWFFLDLEQLELGSIWPFRLLEAYRRAACVLGVLSVNSRLDGEADALGRAIYVDELMRATTSGRLLPVTLDRIPSDELLLGIASLQMWPFSGDEASAKQLADELTRRVHAATPSRPPSADRQRWKKIREDDGNVDWIDDETGWDQPLILRQVPRASSGKDVTVATTSAIYGGCDRFSFEELQAVFRWLMGSSIRYRLPFHSEALELLSVPSFAEANWFHPFDLAIGPGSPPIWVLEEAPSGEDPSPTIMTPCGDLADGTTETAALWLALC